VKPGEPFSYCLLFLDSGGDRAASLDGIGSVDATGGIQLVQASVVPGSDHASVGFVRGYPPSRLDVRPAIGFEVEPTTSTNLPTEVILGLVMEAAGAGGFSGISVDYHVGVVRYRAEFLGNRVHVCAGSRPLHIDCPFPG
jgi:hypothetical protein